MWCFNQANQETEFCFLTLNFFYNAQQNKQAYLVKWRADYVSYNTDEAITCWTVEDVKWANKHENKNLKNVFGYQHQSLVWYYIHLQI